MRKTILGLVATAAIATPLAAATAADASVSYDSTCTPATAKPATTKTVYKYSPVRSSDGPTQWADTDAPANSPATYVVKGKPVNYIRDGIKTSTVPVPATEATTCGVRFSNPTGTRVNLPDVFEVDQSANGWAGYWSTQVAVTVTNDTNTDQEFRVRYADQHRGPGRARANRDHARSVRLPVLDDVPRVAEPPALDPRRAARRADPQPDHRPR